MSINKVTDFPTICNSKHEERFREIVENVPQGI